MKIVTTRLVGSILAAFTVTAGAMAQSYYDDQACRQYADAQTAPLRGQANSEAIGGTLLGAGLGAALGAAVGGGRGAGIGAASGAVVGTGLGAANAQNAAGYLQQQYNTFYAQCMASRRYPPPPSYGGTGAGLCAGPRLSPVAELCTGLKLSPATELLCAALGWPRNAKTSEAAQSLHRPIDRIG
jgi:hypothetical protein